MKKQKFVPLESIINGYQSNLKAEGKSLNTIDSYTIVAKQFARQHKGISKLNDITQKSVDKFLGQFDCRKGTLPLKQIGTRRFLDYIRNEYKFTNVIKIKVKNVIRQESECMSVDEQDKFLRYLRGFGETHIYYILFKLLMLSGLRISELLMLRWSDITSTGLILRQSKHGGVRRKQLKQELLRMLKVYLNARRCKSEIPYLSDGYIFVTKNKGLYRPYTRQGVNLLLKRLIKQIGINKKISPHSLRHGFSLRFLNSGGSLLGLQKILSHQDLKTTAYYLHLADNQIAEELEAL